MTRTVTQTGMGLGRVSGTTPATRRLRAVAQGSGREPAPVSRSTRASSPRRATPPCNRWGARSMRQAVPLHAGRPLAAAGLRQSMPWRHHVPIKSTSFAQATEQVAADVRHELLAGVRKECCFLANILDPDLGIALPREPRLPVREPQECLSEIAWFYWIPAGDARNAARPGSNLGTGNIAGRPGGNSRDACVRFATYRRTEGMSRCLPAECGALSVQQRPQAGQNRRKSA